MKGVGSIQFEHSVKSGVLWGLSTSAYELRVSTTWCPMLQHFGEPFSILQFQFCYFSSTELHPLLSVIASHSVPPLSVVQVVTYFIKI